MKAIQSRQRVCIESPLRGDVALNMRYADALMLDALDRGEAPFLGHLLYTRVYNDSLPKHRQGGIEAHLAWLRVADVVVVGMDLGKPTEGMVGAIGLAITHGIRIEHRVLGVDWAERYVPQPTLRRWTR